MKVEAIDVVKYIQSLESQNKREYKAGKITLETLQREYKKTNRIKDFIINISKDTKP